MEIADGLFLLRLGRGPLASNAYFVWSGQSWTLVDTGWRGSGARIRRAAEELFGKGARPAAIVLTHLHPDHSGAVPELVRAWDVPVYAHPGELPMAAGGYPPDYANPLDRWLVGPVLHLIPRRRLEAALAKSDVTGILQTFDDVVPDLPGWLCVPTPGHTPGHTAFWRAADGVMISGDAAVSVDLNRPWRLVRGRPGLYGPPYVSTWRRDMARQSVERLERFEPRMLAPGHGPAIARVGERRAGALWTRRVGTYVPDRPGGSRSGMGGDGGGPS